MALATRCPDCKAMFRVAADQLKLRGGLVRCGECQHVFDAMGALSYVDDSSLPAAAPAAVGTVIAAIRKAEAVAANELSLPAGDLAAMPLPAAELASMPVAAAMAGAAESSPQRSDDSGIRTGDPAAGRAGAAEPEAASEPSASVIAESTDSPAEAIEQHALAESGSEASGSAEPQAAFLEESTKARSSRSVLLAVGVALLGLLLLAQLVVAQRTELLTRFPQTRPALEQLCRIFRCTVDWPTRSELLAVVGTELQAVPGTDALELTAVVRNRGGVTVALPAIELTLTDTLNRTVARRVFAPLDYLAGASDPQAQLRAGLEAGADLTVRLAFEARDLGAAGFVVYPFYF